MFLFVVDNVRCFSCCRFRNNNSSIVSKLYQILFCSLREGSELWGLIFNQSLLTLARLSNIFQNNTCNIHHSHDFQHEILHSFGIRSPMCPKSNLYVKTTPQRNSSHAPKNFPLWGSLTKDYKVYTMVFSIISTWFYFFKDSYSLLQVFWSN